MLRKEPLSLRLEREGRQGFSRLFCTTLVLPFRSEGGVVFAETPRVRAQVAPRPLVCELKSLGLGNVLQEESLSLCTEQEGRQGFS